MALETGTYIYDLVTTNPVGATDPKSDGDNHIRLIKSCVKASLPGLAGAIFRVQSKSGNYTLLATDNLTVIKCTAALTLSGTASTLGSGFLVIIRNESTGTVSIPGSFTINANEELLLLSDGTNWLKHTFAYTPYLFRVHRNGADQTLTATTATKIQFTTKDIDINSCFDNATNYRFTPTSAGYYYITINVTGAPQAVGDEIAAFIYKNGVVVTRGRAQLTSLTQAVACTANCSDIVYCNGSTDYIEGYTLIRGTTTRTLDGTAANTFMSGWKVR